MRIPRSPVPVDSEAAILERLRYGRYVPPKTGAFAVSRRPAVRPRTTAGAPAWHPGVAPRPIALERLRPRRPPPPPPPPVPAVAAPPPATEPPPIARPRVETLLGG